MTHEKHSQKLPFRIEKNELKAFLQTLVTEKTTLEIHLKNQSIKIEKEQKTIFWLKFPLLYPMENNDLASYISNLGALKGDFVIMLIRAGNAALCYYSDGKMLFHKVIRKYMVRQKQGKSQLTYLQSKGKSRYGSRLRLAQSKEFFAEINEKTNQWYAHLSADYCLFFAPKNLRPYFAKAKPTPLFLANKDRLRLIPFSVRTPNFKELERLIALMQSGILLVDEENRFENWKNEQNENDIDLW